MSDKSTPSAAAVWSWYKKIGFRIIFIFLLAMSIPFSGGWYKNVFTLDWFHPHYRDMYDIARFQPSFRGFFGGKGNNGDGDIDVVNNSNNKNKEGKHHRHGRHQESKQEANGIPPKRGFLADYADWGIAFLIGIAGGLIWTLFDRKSKAYPLLYYWIRVVVRYRAGIGIIGFGFTKLFPTQMPYPSLGLLNSNFGDFTAQKIYWLSVGIVP